MTLILNFKKKWRYNDNQKKKKTKLFKDLSLQKFQEWQKITVIELTQREREREREREISVLRFFLIMQA